MAVYLMDVIRVQFSIGRCLISTGNPLKMKYIPNILYFFKEAAAAAEEEEDKLAIGMERLLLIIYIFM